MFISGVQYLMQVDIGEEGRDVFQDYRLVDLHI